MSNGLDAWARKYLSGDAAKGPEPIKAGTLTLDSVVGRTFLDLRSNFLGVVRSRTDRRTGSKVYWLSGAGGQAYNLARGAQLVDPNTREVYNLGAGARLTVAPSGIQAGGKLSESDLSRLFGAGGAGATGRTQFASEAALDVAQAERLRAQTEIERQQLQATIAATAQRIREIEMQEQAATQRQREALAAEREMLQLRLDNDRRTLVYSEIGATTRTLIQEKGAERGRQVELAGKDPFRFAATLRGRGVTGQTPMDIYKQQGAEFLQAPLPQASMEMPVPQLESILTGMRGLQAPVAAGFGLARGGVIDMERGGDGVFSMRPKQSFLVGEAGPEVLTVGDGKVEVTPLAGGAQAGMSLGGFGSLFDYLRGTRGLTQLAFRPSDPASRVPIDVRAPLLPSQAATLGAFQRAPGSLFQGAADYLSPRQGPVYVVDELGRLRPFTNYPVFEASGFAPSQVETMPFHQLERFNVGPSITNQPFQMPAANYTSAFQALGQPLSVLPGMLDLARAGIISEAEAYSRANQIGFLPAPHKIAFDWRFLDPTERQGILSAYELAGVPQESFLASVTAATPTGRSTRPQNIGWMGTVL